MYWNEALVRYWCEHYYALRDYELNPFEKIRVFERELYLTGSKSYLAPYAETCDLNWEFDNALKKLGGKEPIFKRIYIDGDGELQPRLFDKFCRLLEVENESENNP